jgi:hypothetical protein
MTKRNRTKQTETLEARLEKFAAEWRAVKAARSAVSLSPHARHGAEMRKHLAPDLISVRCFVRRKYAATVLIARPGTGVLKVHRTESGPVA